MKKFYDELNAMFPEYAIDWTGQTYLLRKDVTDNYGATALVTVSEYGVNLVTVDEDGYATMQDFETHDHTKSEFFEDKDYIEIVTEEGDFDIDFIKNFIDADTFSELEGDFTKLTRWLKEGN